jgi:UDP-glucose 4-epimerase
VKILVIGGAGYIGSHMVKLLGQQGASVTTLDDLSSGHRDAVLCGDFVQGNFGDRAVLDAVLA